MFKFLADIAEKNDISKKIQEAVKELKSLEVVVGVPQENGSREGDKISNAELMYIHTNGSELNKIPPRPIIEPSIESEKENIAKILKQASEKAFDGDLEGMKNELEKAGMHGENTAKDWFTNPKNNWKPNNPETVKRKGSERPLIDTGELRKSITYVVRKK